MQYLIVRKNRKYKLIDRAATEINVNHKGEYSYIRICNDKKVFHIESKEKVSEVPIIGKVLHYEQTKTYLGVLIEQADDIENIALTFAELVKRW